MDYQLAFSGRSTMLTITGILSNCGETSDSWTFSNNSIEWVRTRI